MAQTIGVVGLGIMGGAFAGHLVDAGFDVTGFDIVADKIKALEDKGGRGAASARDVAEALAVDCSTSRCHDRR
jgi:3-hydroxyisobutyrate dehydrogenase-like beta-hydroxyacid dehydrogenase